MWKAVLWIALGGSIGSVLRFLSQKWVSSAMGSVFPYGTLFVNITGCLFIGFLFGLSSRWPSHNQELRLFLMTGICGGFTTFSAFALESMLLMQNGKLLSFFIYVSASLLVCIAGAFSGFWISRLV